MITNPKNYFEYRNMRHHGKNHERLVDRIISTQATTTTKNISLIASTATDTDNKCFNTNQMLGVVVFTCVVNFTFVAIVIGCVRCLGSDSPDEPSEESCKLLEEPEDEKESRRRLASLPDNIFTRSIMELDDLDNEYKMGRYRKHHNVWKNKMDSLNSKWVYEDHRYAYGPPTGFFARLRPTNKRYIPLHSHNIQF